MEHPSVLLQQTLKTDYSLLIQIEHWYAHIPAGLNVVLFWLFSFVTKCIIHFLYLLWCVMSAYLSGRHALWNLCYRASVYCTPKRDDRPLAKHLSESRLFTLEAVAEWKYARQSKFITVALHTERYFIINPEIISKLVLYCISAVSSVCTPFEYRYRGRIYCNLWVYCSTTFQ